MRTGRVVLPVVCLCFSALLAIHRTPAQPATAQLPAPTAMLLPGSYRMQPSPPPEGLIHLDVSVSGSVGADGSGLTIKDFTVLDNGAAQKIVSLESSRRATDESERLTEVMLVMDEVNLSPGQTEKTKEESIKFLRQNGGHLVQPVSIYWFTADGLYASIQPSTDGSALADDVAQHRAPRLLWKIPPYHGPPRTREEERDAFWEPAVETIYSIAIEHRQKRGRKALVWLGYGWPAAVKLKVNDDIFSDLVELSTRIRESRIVLSQITPWSDPLVTGFHYMDFLAGVRGIKDLKSTDPEAPGFHFALPVLALQSGGLVVNNSSTIARGVKQCVDDASEFYTVSFDPPHAAQPDEYHDLKVQLKEPEFSARTRTGYYDQPVYYDQPRIPAQRVTVHELEDMLDRSDEEHDSELAKQLSSLELTEQLSSSELATWKNRLRGKKSKAALVALADESAFLDPPATEILTDALPDSATQQRMLSRSVDYLKRVIPGLPNFFATRTTIEYEQPPARKEDGWKTAIADQSLHEAVTQTAILRNRDGQEQLEAEKEKGNVAAEKRDLNFIGVFGPILGSVLVDATRGDSRIFFSHWVTGERGREAVFGYVVRAENLHYNVQHCCLVGGKTFRSSPRYRGELAIDSETGAILRLTIESEPGWILEPSLNPVLPVEDAGMMVEYGPVEIGGKEYICPRRSVVTMRVRNTSAVSLWGQSIEIYAPYETLLNDITYTEYHKFGSETRMLPGYDAVPNASH